MKFGENIDIGIKEYLGRIGTGVVVMLSIIYDESIYEGVYWYNNDLAILHFPIELEELMGQSIESYEYYDEIMAHILNERSLYSDIVPKMEDIFNN